VSSDDSVDTIIVGAGAAGLTAGVELVRAGRKDVILVEASAHMGGLARTLDYKGNRIDVGPEGLVSPSPWVMNWWRGMLPVGLPPDAGDEKTFRRGRPGTWPLLGPATPQPTEAGDALLLLRKRQSHVRFDELSIAVPPPPLAQLARLLGTGASLRAAFDVARARLAPIRPERTLEDYFVNRFGRALYREFFKPHAEKWWGLPCEEIAAACGPTCIDALSPPAPADTLLYPKRGSGQMWDAAAKRFEAGGGRILRRTRLVGVERDGDRVIAVSIEAQLGAVLRLAPKHLISTIPLKDLAIVMQAELPDFVGSIGTQLQYRALISVGVLYRRLRKASAASPGSVPAGDCTIHVQQARIKVSRVQIFNNWSPHMVADPGTTWVGLEYFMREDDGLWTMSDAALKSLALREMQRLGLADESDALDATVLRVPKALPAYYGHAYEHFTELRTHLDGIHNLYLAGRSGMHRQGNQALAMLTARRAVEAILAGRSDKSAIWTAGTDLDVDASVDNPPG
jgi:protoporphyrinogen oxidase